MALIVRTFLFQAFYIPSGSMVPTLKIGDRVLVNKLSYHLHDVHRGDIVVFKRPPRTTGEAEHQGPHQAGDRPARRDHRVAATARSSSTASSLDEPYLPRLHHGPRSTRPEDPGQRQIFVMGDNRDNSGTAASSGPSPTSSIVGRAFVEVWPPEPTLRPAVTARVAGGSARSTMRSTWSL